MWPRASENEHCLTTPVTYSQAMSNTRPDTIHDHLLRLSTALEHLTSEAANPASEQLDTMSPFEIAQLMNQQDQTVALAVEQALEPISLAIKAVSHSIQAGGKVVYVGAGTSGRLGILDASEIPPTFSAPNGWFIPLIAGGQAAMFQAQEGAEDNESQGQVDLAALSVSQEDTIIGLAASGRTPYVLGALKAAKSEGLTTVGISCNRNSPIERLAEIPITIEVGPEILTGSTRLKSGTAQKMVLNMISTGAMVQVGKCFGNRMVDLQATNEKLQARALNLVLDLTTAKRTDALMALISADWDIKVAVLICSSGCDVETARQMITDQGGHLRAALTAAKSARPPE